MGTFKELMTVAGLPDDTTGGEFMLAGIMYCGWLALKWSIFLVLANLIIYFGIHSACYGVFSYSPLFADGVCAFNGVQ